MARTPKLDSTLADAVDLARQALQPLVTAALAGPPAAAQSDAWALRQNAESCYLERTFGSGAGKIELVIQSFGPTSPYHVVLSGANLPTDKDRARPARVGFGGEGAAKDSVVLVGSSGGEPMVLLTVAPPRPIRLFRWLYSYRPVKDDFVVPLDTAAQALFVVDGLYRSFETGRLVHSGASASKIAR